MDGFMTKHVDLAGLIGSRICHDIISPLGAVGNGVELMQLSGLGQGPEFELVRESIEHANARIKFFRVAFGLASSGQMVQQTELSSLIQAAKTPRLKIDWPLSSGLPRLEVKRILLAILAVERLLVAGGTISVLSTEPGRWAVRGQGPRIKDSPVCIDALRHPSADAELEAAEVQFALLRIECQAYAIAVGILTGDDFIELTV